MIGIGWTMDHWLNGCSSVIWYRQTNYLAKRENEEKKKNIGYVWIGSKIGVWLNRSNQPLIGSERWNWGNTKYIFFFGEGSKKPIILSPIKSDTNLGPSSRDRSLISYPLSNRHLFFRPPILYPMSSRCLICYALHSLTRESETG